MRLWLSRTGIFRTNIIALFALAGFGLAATTAMGQTIDFNRDIRPIISNRCLACHGPDDSKREAGLRLDDPDVATKILESGNTAIVAGNVDDSELIRRITSDDESVRMPPTDFGKPLTPKEIATLQQWVQQGGRYAQHWAYVKPLKAELPTAPALFADWPKNAIDNFVLHKMLELGLKPTPQADSRALVRRLFLDVIGLPPTVKECDQWSQRLEVSASTGRVSAIDDAVWSELVDHLFKRQEFGEHWARKWLDLARYADSAGYADDPLRTIWPWRDWVIRSINNNMPFDQFTIEQIAGDMLPEPTNDQLIATAFHRNTMTNNEGGTQDEEFRNVAVVDRVNTTMAVWMGTTIACAQCHSHKYDPLTQDEYFQVFAILNNTQDADRGDESPILEFFTPDQLERQSVLNQRLTELNQMLATTTDARQELKTLETERETMKPEASVPVLREMAKDTRRKTLLQFRGNYLDTGHEVHEGVPAVFPPIPDGQSANRLTFAKWLVNEDNPLTARVVVNRYWEDLFGRGIVLTSEEFGSQGELPTHPELLDWLARELVESGWDTRHLLKMIVTSATYRQSSQVAPAAAAADPDNRWLARGPRVRLSAEMVRDQALQVAGLLSKIMYGPPVKPPQPNLGLTAAFGSSTDWQTSTGADRYRRGIYTTWRRSNPYPSMATFDATNREVCTLRRNQTNTPLQALVTMNDPVYVEAAQALARTMLQQDGAVEEQIADGFQRCLLRDPSQAELLALVALFNDMQQELAAQPDNATKLATDPLGALPEGMDPIRAASMTVVCNVLLNVDEMFLKR